MELLRQQDIINGDLLSRPITIIGVGGIGSMAAMCLAKIGFNDITLYDDDEVKEHNIPSQFFQPEQVGAPKVDAVAQNISQYTDIDVSIVPSLWSESHSPGRIVIAAVDSMSARKEIYESLKEHYSVELFIDARMAAEKIRIHSLRPNINAQQTEYEKSLYDDEAAEEERCTAKAVAYNTFVIGGLVGSLVKRHIMEQDVPHEMHFDLTNYGFYKGKHYGELS